MGRSSSPSHGTGKRGAERRRVAESTVVAFEVAVPFAGRGGVGVKKGR